MRPCAQYVFLLVGLMYCSMAGAISSAFFRKTVATNQMTHVSLPARQAGAVNALHCGLHQEGKEQGNITQHFNTTQELPYDTRIAAENPRPASMFQCDLAKLPMLVVPLFLPNTCYSQHWRVSLDKVIWSLIALGWLGIVGLRYLRGCAAVVEHTDTSAGTTPEAQPGGLEAALARWLGDPGGYKDLDTTVSLYTLLVSNYYLWQVDRHCDRLNDLQHPVLWFFAGTAGAVSLLLAYAPSTTARRREQIQHCTLLCFTILAVADIVAAKTRWKRSPAVGTIDHDPLALHWALFAILVALLARSFGVSERLCSCWLRKFMITTLALQYFNSFLCKASHSGLVMWAEGIQLASYDARRKFSAWPWANDALFNRVIF
eukprot:gnl/TRDRNA2_/TRDRNA2_38873_c0_seq1.p1 gnl/TRDRNA2_/TRDRNA2_38873_c0~~gnl/TRDRNA2_/TRDRNA2_38873_c0_seq1.p1  ORF type:complete len:374 (-),score=32.94 gnl/TRDRNA2_/TRDRNA2_38873_c0_seq1:537-1658(-)